MTYSSTIRIPCNDTQCKKLQSLGRRANFIIKSTVTSTLQLPLPVELRQDDDILLFKRRLKEHFKLQIGFLLEVFFPLPLGYH